MHNCECLHKDLCEAIWNNKIPSGKELQAWLEDLEHQLRYDPDTAWDALRDDTCTLNSANWRHLHPHLQILIHSYIDKAMLDMAEPLPW